MEDKVIVYSAPWCSGCKVLKEILNNNSVPFTEVDIDTKQGSITARENNIRSLPTTIINGQVFVGSSQKIIDNILKVVV